MRYICIYTELDQRQRGRQERIKDHNCLIDRADDRDFIQRIVVAKGQWRKYANKEGIKGGT